MASHKVKSWPWFFQAIVDGYKRHDRVQSSDLSRHIAGCSPRTIIEAMTELQELRQKMAALENVKLVKL